MTEVAVVILNYNGRNFLQQFLPSVIAFSGNAKIIVADNFSTDDSIRILEDKFSQHIEILRLDKNYGFCGGYNRALQKVDAEFYVLLNSDVEVTEGWIEPLIALFKSNKNIVAAQPKIKSFHHKNKFEYAGAAGGFIDSLGYPFCRGRIFDHIEEDHGQYNDTCPVFWATGACLFIRAYIYREMGGLDEDFFAHMEEIDLCWRLNRAGYQVYYCGDSTVYHVGGGTLSKSNPRKTELNFRNGLSLLLKHLPASALWWKIPARLVLDWMAAFLFLLRGSPADAWAISKAHLTFHLRIRKDFAKRREIEKITPNYNVSTIYKRLLPLQFYLYKRNETSKLREFNNPR
jgi:GT2 family glycosyltransferase